MGGNANKWVVPSVISTEVGEATVSVVSPINAHKLFTCPLCDESIAIGEEHLLAIPVDYERLRRHIHTDCLETFMEHKLTIKLHPKDPDVVFYVRGSRGSK